MKFIVIAVLIIISHSAGYSYAEDSKPIDWNKIETQSYSALKDSPENFTEAEIQQALGNMLSDKDQWQRAVIHYKKAVKLDPTLFNSWYNLGLIYIDKEEGNEYFKQAIKANPNYPPPYYWLAYNYCKAKKDKEAIPMFEKYIKIAIKSGDTGESDVVDSAIELLNELKSGKEGNGLKIIRE